ncbi:MAG: WYL domain-containing protein [Desulfobacterales bacterium]|nr:WYL domain-containing protein [Desulfobacterales bacterium]MDD4072418.1 WYL domain-containing protein [Desulfobacterales bacterium]MDD4393799.1 WYL domain-containing protein [Desulfobacterales bacterium]
MAEKRDLYRSYGQKLISLFVRLMFSGERYSLTELSRFLDCSKQTVIRILNDIRMAYGVDIEETFQGNRKYYRIKRPSSPLPVIPLTEVEIRTLQMCRDFTEHLLGKPLYEEATRALLKSRALLPDDGNVFASHFAAFRPGTIDYAPQHRMIRTLIEAMDKKAVCRLTYQAITGKAAKIFFIKPLKLFSQRDTIYLHAQLARTPGERYRSPKFDPLLAVHRMKDVELTDRAFEPPENFDFEKSFNSHFGVVKEKPFTVEVEFAGWSACYVAERIWSPDQKITKKDEDTIILTFTAASEPELTAWLLSFGEDARLIKPDWLVKEIKRIINGMKRSYRNKEQSSLT